MSSPTAAKLSQDRATLVADNLFLHAGDQRGPAFVGCRELLAEPALNTGEVALRLLDVDARPEPSDADPEPGIARVRQIRAHRRGQPQILRSRGKLLGITPTME